MTEPARKRLYSYADAVEYIGAGKSFFDSHIKWRVKWERMGTRSMAERTDLDDALEGYRADRAAGRLSKRRKQVEWTEENGVGKRLDFIETRRPGPGRSTRSGEVVAFARQLDRILAKQKASSSGGSQN